MAPPPYTAVKGAVFSFEKLRSVDVFLSPEMKSTGEVIGLGHDLTEALYKALVGAGSVIPQSGVVLATLADKDKEAGVQLLEGFASLGFRIVATAGTQRALLEKGVEAERVYKIGEGHPDVVDLIKEGKIDLVINTPTRGKVPERNGFQMRRAAVEFRVPCLTSLDLARSVLDMVRRRRAGGSTTPRSLTEYLQEYTGQAPDSLAVRTPLPH